MNNIKAKVQTLINFDQLTEFQRNNCVYKIGFKNKNTKCSLADNIISAELAVEPDTSKCSVYFKTDKLLIINYGELPSNVYTEFGTCGLTKNSHDFKKVSVQEIEKMFYPLLEFFKDDGLLINSLENKTFVDFYSNEIFTSKYSSNNTVILCRMIQKYKNQLEHVLKDASIEKDKYNECSKKFNALQNEIDRLKSETSQSIKDQRNFQVKEDEMCKAALQQLNKSKSECETNTKLYLSQIDKLQAQLKEHAEKSPKIQEVKESDTQTSSTNLQQALDKIKQQDKATHASKPENNNKSTPTYLILPLSKNMSIKKEDSSNITIDLPSNESSSIAYVYNASKDVKIKHENIDKGRIHVKAATYFQFKHKNENSEEDYAILEFYQKDEDEFVCKNFNNIVALQKQETNIGDGLRDFLKCRKGEQLEFCTPPTLSLRNLSGNFGTKYFGDKYSLDAFIFPRKHGWALAKETQKLNKWDLVKHHLNVQGDLKNGVMHTQLMMVQHFGKEDMQEDKVYFKWSTDDKCVMVYYKNLEGRILKCKATELLDYIIHHYITDKLKKKNQDGGNTAGELFIIANMIVVAAGGCAGLGTVIGLISPAIGGAAAGAIFGLSVCGGLLAIGVFGTAGAAVLYGGEKKHGK